MNFERLKKLITPLIAIPMFYIGCSGASNVLTADKIKNDEPYVLTLATKVKGYNISNVKDVIDDVIICSNVSEEDATIRGVLDDMFSRFKDRKEDIPRLVGLMKILELQSEEDENLKTFYGNALELVDVTEGLTYSNEELGNIIASLEDEGTGIELSDEVTQGSKILFKGLNAIKNKFATHRIVEVIEAVKSGEEYGQYEYKDIAEATIKVLRKMQEYPDFNTASLKDIAGRLSYTSDYKESCSTMADALVGIIEFMETTGYDKQQVMDLLSKLDKESDFREQGINYANAMNSVADVLASNAQISPQLLLDALKQVDKKCKKCNSTETIQAAVKKLDETWQQMSDGSVIEVDISLYKEFQTIDYKPELANLAELESNAAQYEGKFITLTATPKDFAVIEVYNGQQSLTMQLAEYENSMLCFARKVPSKKLEKLAEELSKAIKDNSQIRITAKYDGSYLDIVQMQIRGDQTNLYEVSQ